MVVDRRHVICAGCRSAAIWSRTHYRQPKSLISSYGPLGSSTEYTTISLSELRFLCLASTPPFLSISFPLAKSAWHMAFRQLSTRVYRTDRLCVGTALPFDQASSNGPHLQAMINDAADAIAAERTNFWEGSQTWATQFTTVRSEFGVALQPHDLRPFFSYSTN